MGTTEVYLGLGGNIGDTYSVLRSAIYFIAAIPGVYNVQASRFYETTPVSYIPQKNYVNAVCRLTTILSARRILSHLQDIEKKLGKVPKEKDEPRALDIDILLFGLETHQDQDLQIPHPRWMERLFVLKPMADLTNEVVYPESSHPDGMRKLNINEYLKSFQNINNEIVAALT